MLRHAGDDSQTRAMRSARWRIASTPSASVKVGHKKPAPITRLVTAWDAIQSAYGQQVGKWGKAIAWTSKGEKSKIPEQIGDDTSLLNKFGAQANTELD